MKYKGKITYPHVLTISVIDRKIFIYV